VQTSFCGTGIGVNIEGYHTRTGTFMINYMKEFTMGVCEELVMGNSNFVSGTTINGANNV
jgi:hypothetical protein